MYAEVDDVEVLNIVDKEDYDNDKYSSYLANAAIYIVNNFNLPTYIEYVYLRIYNLEEGSYVPNRYYENW
ncbi:MAG: hypothetical protein HDR17_14245 [Lachnospiraceae bacterium]|nr:hypothetical protein [Lachnospiraceae bacterium]